MSTIIVDNDYKNTRSSLHLMFFKLVLEIIWTQPEKLVLLMPNACAARALVITFISSQLVFYLHYAEEAIQICQTFFSKTRIEFYM